MRGLLLLVLLLVAPFADGQPAKTPRIGVVFYNVPLRDLSAPNPDSRFARALIEGLRERGWIEGKSAHLLWRTSEGRHERIPALVQELLDQHVDVLIASGNDIAAESVKRSPSTPVVLASSDYPVETGLVKSLAKPGGNITGLTNWVGAGLNSKRLGLLKEAAPGVSKVAVLVPPAFQGVSPQTQAAIDALRIELIAVRVSRADELEAALGIALRAGANGVFVTDYPFAFVGANQDLINRLAATHRLPALHSASNAAESGALMAYGPNIYSNYRRSAYFVDKILRGAKAGDLPIEQPDNLEFVVNVRTARALGLTLPQSILVQATKVID